MLYSSDDTHIKNRNDTRATPRRDKDTPRRVRMTSIEKITPCFFTYFLITKAPKQKLIEKVTLFFGFLWLFQKK
jgi:hypothetical protein